MKKARILKSVKLLSFLLVFCLVFSCVSSVLVNPDPNQGHRLFHWIHDFHDEPKDTLDAIFIGSSVVHGYWLSPVAYAKYGITVWPYCSGGQSLSITQSIIQNVRKTQKDALLIISTNGVWERMDDTCVHWCVWQNKNLAKGPL